MNRKMYIITDTQQEPDLLPLIAIFTLPADVEEEDIHIAFSKALAEWALDMDCLPERHAADAVCEAFGCTVEFVEASQVYGMGQTETAPAPNPVYLVVEFYSDENLVETTCYAKKEGAIAEWRESYANAMAAGEIIEEVRPDAYYKARSRRDMSNYYEMTIIAEDVLQEDARCSS